MVGCGLVNHRNAKNLLKLRTYTPNNIIQPDGIIQSLHIYLPSIFYTDL